MSLRHAESLARARDSPTGRSDAVQLRPLWQEALLLVTLLVVYRVGRLFGDMDATRGLRAGASVLGLEADLHLPSERTVQALALHVPDLVRAVNVYYAVMHFTVVVLALLWLHHWRPAGYLLLRRTLVAATAAGLAVQLLAPVAPPRMQPGFVDTGRLLGPSVYGAPADDHLTNQFAAMPSLHVGWALAVALVLVAALHSRWRWLAVVHPVVTLVVVVVSGNHYWLDAVVGSLLVVLAFGYARHRDAGQLAERRALASPTLGWVTDALTPDQLAFLQGLFDHARDGRAAELVQAVDAGVPANLTNSAGDTLLILAAYHGHPEVVEVLLARGADTERVNDRGQTALGAAVFKQDQRSVQALLAAGADPDGGGRTAREIAAFFDLPAMTALLEA